MTLTGLPGFRDFAPTDLALRAHIFAAWRRVATRYGFEEYDGPPLEPLELYTAKSGEEIVAQLYAFVDKGDRQVALRPEMTPTLARMVAARANGLKKPIRWFSLPQLFRYERQQRGRLREHFQLNCDIIGEAGPLADAEIIALAVDIMRELGLGPGGVRVRVSDRQVMASWLEGLGVVGSATATVFQAMDRMEKDPDGAQVLLRSVMTGEASDRILRLRHAEARAALRHEIHQSRVPLAGADRLAATLQSLDDMGLGEWVDFDPAIVRGLAYYTGTVFELFDAQRKLRAICGGGRYDALLAGLGGTDLPAVGFGMGDVVLGELLKDRGLVPRPGPTIDVFVAVVSPADTSTALGVVHALRDGGCRTEFALGSARIGKQLDLANTRGARLAVIIGPDDRERGQVQLKQLTNQQQEAVPQGRVVERCRQLLEENG
jgi:histidyl-tRNA synthetase